MTTFPASVHDATQSLPPKWDAFFKQIVKQYETKQYSKALKSANEMLKIYPEHAETLAIKGIVLTNVDKAERLSDSPIDLVKEGIRRNIRSPFCWQILGKLYRGDKNYAEAIKCYRNVLKFDRGNMPVLRDLATMETQTRDLSGLISTRKMLLSLMPSMSTHWTGLAIAHDLKGETETALQLMEELEKVANDTLQPIEKSEHDLYRLHLLQRLSRHAEIIDLLPSMRATILDIAKVHSMEADSLLRLGRKGQAETAYRRMFESNPNSMEAIQGFVSSKTSFAFSGDFQDTSLQTEAKKEIQTILEDLTPASSVIDKIALDLASSADFSVRLRKFAEPFVKLNISSIFSALKLFYVDAARESEIEAVLLQWKDELEQNHDLAKDRNANPSALLWVLLLLATHYLRTGNIAQAESYLTKARDHTPTADTVYIVQARIAKVKGDKDTLLRALKTSTEMDSKDRYTSNRYVKHLLRCHETAQAESVFRSFNDIQETDLLKHIADIQCLWYEIELANSYHQQGDVLSALQIYLVINRHFNKFREDEFDFHGYCLQRGMISAYVDTMKNNDTLKSHPQWIRAAHGAVQCYLDIFDANDVKLLESRRTPHGQSIATNESIDKLPDLSHPLINALEFVRLLEKHDGRAKSFLLSSEVYSRLKKNDATASALVKALRLADGVIHVRAKKLVETLEKTSDIDRASLTEIHRLFEKLRLA